MTVTLPCNRTCECDTSVFAPICTSTGETYFSACHAGCANLTQIGSQIGNTTVDDFLNNVCDTNSISFCEIYTVFQL